MKKKILCIVVSLSLCMSSTIITFAEEGETEKNPHESRIENQQNDSLLSDEGDDLEENEKVMQKDENSDFLSDEAGVGGRAEISSSNLTAVTNLKAVSAGKNKVQLSWNESPGAEGYLIYAQKQGQYHYCGMTTTGTSFVDRNALDNEYNFYWVFPYVRDSSGKMIPGKCTKYVFAKGVTRPVTNLRATSVTGGVKLNWNSVEDAEGYLIYGKTAQGAYGYKGMTTTGVTFTDKNAAANEYNFYWVFPYHRDSGNKMIVGGTANYVYGKPIVQTIQRVYWVSGGKSYHFSKNCTTLKRSKVIIEGTLEEAFSQGKADPCNICANGK